MNVKKLVFKGRAWLIKDEEGRLIDDIDTDQIYHNSHLAVTELAEMGQYAFGNLKGYEHFAKEVRAGDMVVAGKNFGAGSSRQQAVDCFISLGISCVLAESFGAIYKRNAINTGFPVLVYRNLDLEKVNHLDVIEVDLKSKEIRKDGKKIGEIPFISKVQMDIYLAGNIFEYGKRM
ncbi:MAG TPA: 3-isopropylmalate dehydratase [Thermoplasmata archaeon]|nr:3-isopropylmalate dehydratase [Thermoplasmata archaeon]